MLSLTAAITLLPQPMFMLESRSTHTPALSFIAAAAMSRKSEDPLDRSETRCPAPREYPCRTARAASGTGVDVSGATRTPGEVGARHDRVPGAALGHALVVEAPTERRGRRTILRCAAGPGQ